MFPLHLFKKQSICCLPMKGSPLTEGPIGSRHSRATPANPQRHSNVAHLYQGTTSSSDPLFMMCKRGPEGKDTTEISVWGPTCVGLQIWDYRRAELMDTSEVLTCFSATC